MTLLIIGIVLVTLLLLICYLCFCITFFVTRKQKLRSGEFSSIMGDIYDPWREKMANWVRQSRALPCQDFSIVSDDGLTLRGKFFEFAPNAPIELMVHGYRGTAERDLSGGVQRCFALGHSALLIDQRACGSSDGRVITFGLREHKDCLKWVDFLIQTFGPEVKIFLTGISMGAATVLMAAGQPLPDNVAGVLADCGYTSAKEIIKVVIRRLGLPPTIAYPFVKVGAFLFGRFRLEKDSPIQSIARCRIPVMLIHGETDDFVPTYMSRNNFDVCTCRKRLVTIPGAGHGLCYPVDPEKYIAEMRDFFKDEPNSRNSNA